MAGNHPELPGLAMGHWRQDLTYPQDINAAMYQGQPWAVGQPSHPLPSNTLVPAPWPWSPPFSSAWGPTTIIGYQQPMLGQINTNLDAPTVRYLQPFNHEAHGLLHYQPITYQYMPNITGSQNAPTPLLSSQFAYYPEHTSLSNRPADPPPIATNQNTIPPARLPNESGPPPPYPGLNEYLPAPPPGQPMQIDLEANIHANFANYNRLTNAIHPLFQRQNFNIQSSPNDDPILLPRDKYELLKPSLRLASHLITHPSALIAWARFLNLNITDSSQIDQQQRDIISQAFESLISKIRFCIREINPLTREHDHHHEHQHQHQNQQQQRIPIPIPNQIISSLQKATSNSHWAHLLMHNFGLSILLIQNLAIYLPIPVLTSTRQNTNPNNNNNNNNTLSSNFTPTTPPTSENSQSLIQKITTHLFGVKGLKISITTPLSFSSSENITVQHITRIDDNDSGREAWFPVHLKWVERFFEEGFWDSGEGFVWEGLVVPGERRRGG
ncbi:MAG: hypothetical protein M1812_006351 [Candelaria pacifica]|nr:MAG: hypothetical protein M1812_006351 [Candelaria pacifica]